MEECYLTLSWLNRTTPDWCTKCTTCESPNEVGYKGIRSIRRDPPPARRWFYGTAFSELRRAFLFIFFAKNRSEVAFFDFLVFMVEIHVRFLDLDWFSQGRALF